MAGKIMQLAFMLLIALPANAAEPLREITPAELKSRLAENAVVLVDVMSSLHYMDHHIPGSILIPASDFEAIVEDVLPDKGKAIVFYCESSSCHRSRRVYLSAIEKGYQDIYVLAGGFPAWKAAGYTVVSDKRVPRTGIWSIKPAKFTDFVNSKADVSIIDIRTPEEFETGHILGAINVPVDDLRDRYHEIPLNSSIIVVDANGYSSFLVAAYLHWKGYVDIVRLFGGMRAWDLWHKKGQGTI